MFIAVALFIMVVIGLLAFRDRLKHSLFSPGERKHILLKAKEKIALGQWEEAKESLAPLVYECKGEKETLLYYIQTLVETGESEKGYLLSKKSSAEFPEELLFRVVEGRALLALGRWEEAYAAFQVAYPVMKSEEDLIAYAEAALLAGASECTLQLLEPLLAQSRSGKLFFLFGDGLSAQKRFQEAIASYGRAMELGYNNRQLEISLAHALRRSGGIQEAEQRFRKILKTDGADVLATIGLGNCMQARGEHVRALSLFRSSKAWNKKDPLLCIQTGILALYLHRDNLAEECFGKALTREISPELLFYFGYSLQRQKKWNDAEKVFLTMVERYPEDLRGIEAVLWLFAAGQSVALLSEKAVDMAKQLYAKKTDSAAAELLSAVEARAGNFSRALEIQETLAVSDRNSEEISRRRQCLNSLRRHLPLDDSLLRRRVA